MKKDNFLGYVFSYFNLENEVDDFDRIHESIKKDIVFKGTNLWILMFAIVVASVGLNMNSTAVIIGAMLISPLMGPINGMGYSIATYDMPLFRQSLKNFSFAVFASLAASTTYFFLSPISTAHSELLARTSPTIYDVLIALFGGLAGIVAISSKNKGNVIPGVAIATALMPPLCTAGYGLATSQFQFFFGAIYLFTINTVFIALSSVAVAQILKFPISEVVAVANRKKINSWISVVIVLVSFPSIYFGYNLVQNEQFIQKSNEYIAKISLYEGNFLLKSDINPKKKSLKLIYGGTSLNDSQKEKITQMGRDYLPEDSEITIEQGLSFDAVVMEDDETKNLKAEINRLNQQLRINENVIDSLTARGVMGQSILREIQSIYPVIESCSYSKAPVFTQNSDIAEISNLVVFKLKKGQLNSKDKEKIQQWLSVKLSSENVQVFYEKYL
jgi:uncharacterized hydrophobic protein (TIGR00271 family)